jgi:ATP-dependent Clp protease adaptor protein ClpS
MHRMADVNKPSEPSGPTTKIKAKPAKAKASVKPRKLPPYNVILLDDDEHTYAYVIEMLQKIFAHGEQQAYKMAKEVDETGRVIVLTTHKERAELKRDQIHGFGADPRLEASRASMRATIEPARSGA